MTAEISAPSPIATLTAKPQIVSADDATADPAGPVFAAVLAKTAGPTPLAPLAARPPIGTTDCAPIDPAGPALAVKLPNVAMPSGTPLPAAGKTLPHDGSKRNDVPANDTDSAGDLPSQALDHELTEGVATGSAPAVPLTATVNPLAALSVAPPAIVPAKDKPARYEPASNGLAARIGRTSAKTAIAPGAVNEAAQTGSRPAVSAQRTNTLEMPRQSSSAPTTASATPQPAGVVATVLAQTLSLPTATLAGTAKSASTTPALTPVAAVTLPTTAAPATSEPDPVQAPRILVAAAHIESATPLTKHATSREAGAPTPVVKTDSSSASPTDARPTAEPPSPTLLGALTSPIASPAARLAAQTNAPAALASNPTQQAASIAPTIPAASSAISPAPAAKVAHTVAVSAAVRTGRSPSIPAASTSTATLGGDLRPEMSALDIGAQPQIPLAADATQAQPAADLGTLVDRLIAARQVSTSAAVGAHIAHADFGRIDLSFAADAAGLTVGMRSHDPDFAPSVQAATHTAPTQAAATDSRSPQDSPSQQGSAASGNAASQGSARDQGRAAPGQPSRETPNSRGFSSSGAPQSAADRSEDPRGIYA